MGGIGILRHHESPDRPVLAVSAAALVAKPGTSTAGSGVFVFALAEAEGVGNPIPEFEDGVPLDDDRYSFDGVGLFVAAFPELRDGYRKVETLPFFEIASEGAGELTERRNACVRTGVVGERFDTVSVVSPRDVCIFRGSGGRAAIRRVMVGSETLLVGVAFTSRIDRGELGIENGRARLTLSTLMLPSLSKLGMTLMILRMPAAGGGSGLEVPLGATSCDTSAPPREVIGGDGSRSCCCCC